MTRDTEDVVARVVAKLRREKVTRMYEGDYINPNGPEAADLIQSLSDRIDVLEGLLDEAESWLAISSVVNHDALCAKIRAALHQEDKSK